MDTYEHIAQMKSDIARRDWDALERSYRQICVELAGEGQASKIASLDFSSYQDDLSRAFAEAIRQAKELNAKAVYFEYDLDNDWQANFFLCGEYNQEDLGDDDWACDWLAVVKAPAFAAASAVYSENHFDRTATARGSTLYLIARTIASLGRCFDGDPSGNLAVCVAFHDQDPIMRLRERGG